MRTDAFVTTMFRAQSLTAQQTLRTQSRISPARADVHLAATALGRQGVMTFAIDDVARAICASGRRRSRNSVREALQEDAASPFGQVARLRPGVYALRPDGVGPEARRASGGPRRHSSDAVRVAATQLSGGGSCEVTRTDLAGAVSKGGVLYSARAITDGLARLVHSGELVRVGHGRYVLSAAGRFEPVS